MSYTDAGNRNALEQLSCKSQKQVSPCWKWQSQIQMVKITLSGGSKTNISNPIGFHQARYLSSLTLLKRKKKQRKENTDFCITGGKQPDVQTSRALTNFGPGFLQDNKLLPWTIYELLLTPTISGRGVILVFSLYLSLLFWFHEVSFKKVNSSQFWVTRKMMPFGFCNLRGLANNKFRNHTLQL